MDKQIFINKLTYDFAIDYLRQNKLDKLSIDKLETDLDEILVRTLQATSLFYKKINEHINELEF